MHTTSVIGSGSIPLMVSTRQSDIKTDGFGNIISDRFPQCNNDGALRLTPEWILSLPINTANWVSLYTLERRRDNELYRRTPKFRRTFESLHGCESSLPVDCRVERITKSLDRRWLRC